MGTDLRPSISSPSCATADQKGVPTISEYALVVAKCRETPFTVRILEGE